MEAGLIPTNNAGVVGGFTGQASIGIGIEVNSPQASINTGGSVGPVEPGNFVFYDGNNFTFYDGNNFTFKN